MSFELENYEENELTPEQRAKIREGLADDRDFTYEEKRTLRFAIERSNQGKQLEPHEKEILKRFTDRVKAGEFNKDEAGEINESVHHPSHYNVGRIEVIDMIEDQGMAEGFCLGNAIKYIMRAGKKDPKKLIEDLEKAAWYLNRYISFLKNKDPKIRT